MARLENDVVVQLWFVGSDFSRLMLRGRTFPSVNMAKTLRGYFNKCKPDFQASGGVLIYCEDDGIELSYSLAGSQSVKFDGLSVLSADVVNRILRGP